MIKAKAIHELATDKYDGKDKCIYHEGDKIAFFMSKDFDFFSSMIKDGEVDTCSDYLNDEVNRDLFSRGWKVMLVKSSGFTNKKMPWR